jgi:stress-induced morphogen
MDPQLIKDQLYLHFPDAVLTLQDLTGGGDHWRLEIRSSAFNGKSLVQQHQLVYRALQQWINKEIHALALSTIPMDAK